MRKDRDWLDYATLAALVGAIFAAVVASYIQHSDTQAALKIAAKANALSQENAEKQARDTTSALELSKKAADAAAKAVETSVADERARLFVANFALIRANEKDPNPKISFQIANLGKTSAVLTEVALQCRIFDASTPFPSVQLTIRNIVIKQCLLLDHLLLHRQINHVRWINPLPIRILLTLTQKSQLSYSQDTCASRMFLEKRSLSILAFIILARTMVSFRFQPAQALIMTK